MNNSITELFPGTPEQFDEKSFVSAEHLVVVLRESGRGAEADSLVGILQRVAEPAFAAPEASIFSELSAIDMSEVHDERIGPLVDELKRASGQAYRVKLDDEIAALTSMLHEFEHLIGVMDGARFRSITSFAVRWSEDGIAIIDAIVDGEPAFVASEQPIYINREGLRDDLKADLDRYIVDNEL